MVENCGIEAYKWVEGSQNELKAHSTLEMIKKDETSPLRSEGLESGLVHVSRKQSQLGAPSYQKGCLKPPTTPQTTHHDSIAKRIRFPTLDARCLVTNIPYQAHPQDGKSWRRQQSEEQHEERSRQALSGSQEYRPYVMTDRWADRGWESNGLGEDTPMGGMSEEMDEEAARWRARQMEFDTRLEEQQDLAEEHRFAMESEVRRLYGAEDMMGTRDFVRHRLERMATTQSWTS